ncbi:unnamed protein product [Rhizophagus irregularis]|nr:unnamed protein product [Rhizophagus irregularis]
MIEIFQRVRSGRYQSESCSLASSKHKNRNRIVQGIVKSARKALERRVYECFGSNGNGSPGPTETPSNNTAPNGAPLDSKVQDPCRFVWIPVGDPNKISISNVQENLYTTKFFPLRTISNWVMDAARRVQYFHWCIYSKSRILSSCF